MSVFALVDCNNFFVSCERVFRPDLWDKPVAVLSNNDGCVVARSNEVKALGVGMGEPFFKIRDLVRQHNVTLFSGNFYLYGDLSQRVVQILQSACPSVEVYSIDESFLEISDMNIDDYEVWGRELRARILQYTGLPVSIGIAPTKTLAKAASEYVKKTGAASASFLRRQESSLGLNGAYSIINNPQRHEDLLKWLPLEDIWGVGRRTAPKLREMGLKTAWDLSQVGDKWALQQLRAPGLRMVHELRGESNTSLLRSTEPQKSIACTRSFGHNIRAYHELEAAVATFAAQASSKLRGQGEIACEVLTFLRNSKHSPVSFGASKSVRLASPSSDTGAIIAAALQNLQQIYDPDFSYKKAGVILLDLVPQTARQLSFTDEPANIDRKVQLMQTVDQINARYGVRQIRHASEQPLNKTWFSRRESRSPAYTTNWHDLPVVKS